jgi:hypothetical protein
VVIFLDFPTIHTNFWDAVIAIPAVMVSTQMLKIFLKIPKKFVPLLALILGLFISIFLAIEGIFLRVSLWDTSMDMQLLGVMLL